MFTAFKGMFKKKLPIVEKPLFYSIVCPHCFHKFEPAEVVFRATHNKEEDEFFALQEDMKLNQWRKKYLLPEVFEMEAIIDPQMIPEENKIYSGHVLVGVVDGYGETTRRRLCPECHNELIVNAGKVPSNIISIIGASQVGKTVYMTTLIHTLQTITASNFGAACIPLNNDVSRNYKDKYYVPLYETGTMLSATNPNEKPEPLIYQFIFKDEQMTPLTLVFFDVAGEGMTTRDYLDKFATHIKNSAGILFLVDPLQIKVIRDKIRLKLNEADGGITKAYDEPRDVAISLYENFIAHQDKSKTDIPTAVIITKSDMLEYLKDEDGEYIPSNSNVFRNVVHKGFLNSTEFDNINGEIGRFIGKVDRPFKDALEVYFSDIAYFAVSALGTNPVDQGISNVINPKRVDEPFIWLLHKLNFVGRRES